MSGGPVSAQTRRNRSIAGRKAALARKRRAAWLAEMGPDGPVRGSAPVDGDPARILARISAPAIEGG